MRKSFDPKLCATPFFAKILCGEESISSRTIQNTKRSG
jgi:hypothetical protein